MNTAATTAWSGVSAGEAPSRSSSSRGRQVARGEGCGVRRASVHAVAPADLGVRVDAVGDQQLDPHIHAVRHGPGQLEGELVGIVESELEEQLEVAVVGRKVRL